MSDHTTSVTWVNLLDNTLRCWFSTPNAPFSSPSACCCEYASGEYRVKEKRHSAVDLYCTMPLFAKFVTYISVKASDQCRCPLRLCVRLLLIFFARSTNAWRQCDTMRSTGSRTMACVVDTVEHERPGSLVPWQAHPDIFFWALFTTEVGCRTALKARLALWESHYLRIS